MVEISLIKLFQRCLSGKRPIYRSPLLDFVLVSKAYISHIRPIYAKEIHGFFESARLGVTRGVVAMPGKSAGKTKTMSSASE